MKTVQGGKFQDPLELFLQSCLYDTPEGKSVEDKLLAKIYSTINSLMNRDKRSSLIVIMGRNSERPENLLEILLSTPKIIQSINESIIKDIWKELDLSHTPQVLISVSDSFKKIFFQLN